jgi:hypothetical protein
MANDDSSRYTEEAWIPTRQDGRLPGERKHGEGQQKKENESSRPLEKRVSEDDQSRRADRPQPSANLLQAPHVLYVDLEVDPQSYQDERADDHEAQE